MQGTNKLRGTTLIPAFGSQLISECRLSISLTRCHVPSYFQVRMHRFKRALTWEYHTGHFLRMLSAGDILSLQGYQVLLHVHRFLCYLL